MTEEWRDIPGWPDYQASSEDASPRFGAIEEVIDGKRIRRPVMEPFQPFDFHEENDPIFVVDAHGERWFLGKINGVLHKRRH